MKKITKTFYIAPRHLERIRDNTKTQACGIDFFTLEGTERNDLDTTIEIQISFPAPERRIEITESELELKFNQVFPFSTGCWPKLKQKLFGEDN